MVSASTVKRRSVARLAGRKRPSYYESDNDEFDRDTDDEHEIHQQERPSKRRSARQVEARERVTYQESDSEAEALDVHDGMDLAQGLPPVQRQSRHRRRHRPATRSTASRQKSARKATGRPKKSQQQRRQGRHRGLGAPLKKREVPDAKKLGFTGPSDGRIPDWTSLPLEILRDVFVYAAQPLHEPLHEQSLMASGNATWLMRAARTCRAFAIPALEAFYQSPPLRQLIHPHYLLDLLGFDQDTTYLNYKVKVKDLKLSVLHTLAYTAGGRPLFNLSDLVRETPLLQHLEISQAIHRPPYRMTRPLRWTYPPDLFDTLNATGIQLRSWTWSRHMFPSTMLPAIYPNMVQIHKSRAFEYLERVVIYGFQVNDSSAEPRTTASTTEADTSSAPTLDLAAAVSALPSLKDITFISCDIIMDTFLQRIPPNLERLELSNCLEVYSGMLQSYFAKGGSHLRELELKHNPALNLSFLTSLQTLCPRLETLKMDCTYFSERHTFNDAYILYDELLGADEIPSWPASLRRLELKNLQRCPPEPAQNLFASLIDSSEQLPDLRDLKIEAHIDIPWRDRAGFRDKWIERLRRVFLRRTRDPNPQWGSLRQMRLWKDMLPVRALEGADATWKQPSPRVKIPAVSASSATAEEGKQEEEEGVFYTSPSKLPEPRPAPARRSTRVAELHQSSAEDPDTDGLSSPALTPPSSADDDEDDEEGMAGRKRDFIQGLCTTVDIRIDNQRPMEKQWTEGEFIDSEVSGDEDWVEGAELNEGDGGYFS